MGISKRSLGINFTNEKQAAIRIWAPNATQVTVQSDDFYVPLDQEDYGYWSAITEKLGVGSRYWVLLDNEKRLPDPASLSQPDGVHEASEALDLNYYWQDKDWSNIPLKDYIFYELHTGTFTPEGNFEGIAAKLDYLLELGVTAIELMPIAAFPGTRNWGYDGVFPFAVQSSYGGAKGLQALVNLCHQKGLAVVLDVVYNHVGPEGNYLAAYGPYFTDKYQTPWGSAVNYDDRDCDAVRDMVVENVLMWFRDFHIDALRLDAVHAIKDFSALHVLAEIREKTNALSATTGRTHYLIAESDLNDPRYISSLKENGLGMDAQWTDEFHHALRVTAGEPKKGYYSDFSGISDLAKSYTDAYVYTRTYSKERGKTFGRKAAANQPGSQFVVFSQNHDQVGNRMLGERSSTLYSFEMQKLLAAAVLFSPFQPLLFMGEEWGETNPFLYFVSHGDATLVEQVREGRKAEFAAMHTESMAPDPQDESTFQASKLNWERLKNPGNHQLFLYYQQLIALRKKYEVLSGADRNACRVFTFHEKNCLLLERGVTGSKALVLCFLNFSTSMQHLIVPGYLKQVSKIIDSSDPIWHGPKAAPDQLFADQELTLHPESFIAYSAEYV